ncbi:hypothetical protein B0H16DRAFT_1465369 [Mycena metata]|uniref:Uncharacterized protein n=1 Tax=Mycena metata TaxID=1033252 RepID=A0AAD7MZL4_9AGAR|nr:hypothetical protein B0H16DRAFT_1465369 [Mycena metata]
MPPSRSAIHPASFGGCHQRHHPPSRALRFCRRTDPRALMEASMTWIESLQIKPNLDIIDGDGRSFGIKPGDAEDQVEGIFLNASKGTVPPSPSSVGLPGRRQVNVGP